MSLVAKIFTAIIGMFLIGNVLQAKDLSVLVIGQSISSNCNEYSFSAEANVLQYNLDGKIIQAQDPFVWADCRGGSIWIPLGKLLIADKMADRVIFMPIGVGGTKVSDWLEGGRAYPKLEKALSIIRENKLKFDFVLWYQGSSDIGSNPNDYKQNFYKLYRTVRSSVQSATPWLVAMHSRCFGGYDKGIENAQAEIGKGLPFFFQGPNGNSLGDEYRFDQCHLTRDGQVKMAELWLSSIKTAITKKSGFENESLLYIFKKIPF